VYAAVKAGPVLKTAVGFAEHGAVCAELSSIMNDLTADKGVPAEELCALLDDDGFRIGDVLDSIGNARSKEDEAKLCELEKIHAKIGAALKKARVA
jgi:hypothetical protein